MDKPRHPSSSRSSCNPPSAWSDEALLGLVLAADEAEQLDGEARSAMPSLRLAGTLARPRASGGVVRSWRWLAAAAALIAVGVMIVSPRISSAPKQVANSKHNPDAPAPEQKAPPALSVAHDDSSRPTEVVVPIRHASRPGDATVILTISQDADGRCRCVTSVTHQLLAGQNVGDLATTELLGVGLQRLCESSPERVLVLGMSGPRELLPQNKAEAERFASCLDRGPGDCETDATCFASSALACVSPSVNIVAETVAMRK